MRRDYLITPFRAFSLPSFNLWNNLQLTVFLFSEIQRKCFVSVPCPCTFCLIVVAPTQLLRWQQTAESVTFLPPPPAEIACSCQDQQTELWDEAESLGEQGFEPMCSAAQLHQVQEVVNIWFLEQLEGASTALKVTCAAERRVNTVEIARVAKNWGKRFLRCRRAVSCWNFAVWWAEGRAWTGRTSSDVSAWVTMSAASYFTCFSQGCCQVAGAIGNALLMQILCLEEFSNQALLT